MLIGLLMLIRYYNIVCLK